MKLLRFRSLVPNFGDDLNEVLWPELAPSLFDGDEKAGEAHSAFVGIGTIIGLDPDGSKHLHVFSSGIGYTGIDRWAGRDVRYHCVRGPVTARVLGLPVDRQFTDGAILAPLIDRFRFPPASSEPASTGRYRTRKSTNGDFPSRLSSGPRTIVVPHYETIAFPGWQRAAALAGFNLVDPRGTPESVIAALAGADLVLTESLHGAILADSYGVPWRGFAVSRNFSTAKWADWAGSLGLSIDIALVPPPDPMPLLRFGKRNEPFGTMLALDLETAFGEFQKRISPTEKVSFLKGQAKRLLRDVPVTRRLLGFSPQRTAQALVDLAAMEPYLSRPRVREGLRDRMLARLDALVRQYGTSMADLP